ncbi:hypothetical protein ACEPPN_013061 [Leptodophora sp. 'Broadleaf-Isolate-01']
MLSVILKVADEAMEILVEVLWSEIDIVWESAGDTNRVVVGVNIDAITSVPPWEEITVEERVNTGIVTELYSVINEDCSDKDDELKETEFDAAEDVNTSDETLDTNTDDA